MKHKSYVLKDKTYSDAEYGLIICKASRTALQKEIDDIIKRFEKDNFHEWQIKDVVAWLPGEWDATVQPLKSVYV